MSQSYQCDGANKGLNCYFFFLLDIISAVTTGAITVWKSNELNWQVNI